jgi:adenine phosphoribosyltransferase
MKETIRDIPDFPKEGIIFKDITPLLADPVVFQKTINTLKDRYANKKLDAVVGVEARGFIFASALAYALGVGVVMVRKPGKLPYKTFQEAYSLEYGTDIVEVHQDAFQEGQNILVIDDVLATGGTLSATLNLNLICHPQFDSEEF